MNLKSLKRVGILLMATLTCATARAEEPLNVLLVGNSQCPLIISNRLIENLAAADEGGRPIKITGCVKGGATLRSHWDAGTGPKSARGMIAGGKWDFVVIQEIYNAKPDAFQPYARKFHKLIKESGATTVLFGTASILNLYPGGFDGLHRMHLAMGRELDTPIVDASAAYFKYFREEPTSERQESLFAKDRAHPGLWGSYLYSCIIYNVITGRTAVGLAAPDEIPTDVATELQGIAWTQYQETTAELNK